MLEALWFSFSNPNIIVGRSGAGGLVMVAAVVALVTAGFMVAVGRRVMPYSSVLAVMMGVAFLPLGMNAFAFLVARSHPSGTDGGGMLIAAAFLLSVWALPVTLATSVIYVVIRKRGYE